MNKWDKIESWLAKTATWLEEIIFYLPKKVLSFLFEILEILGMYDPNAWKKYTLTEEEFQKHQDLLSDKNE